MSEEHDTGERRVVEVEVERLPEGHDPRRDGPPGAGSGAAGRALAAERELGPVLAGLAIDALDLLTPSPLFGLVVGTPLGYYIARRAGAAPASAGGLALLVGLYCAVPLTQRLPVATLVGLSVKLGRVLRAPR